MRLTIDHRTVYRFSVRQARLVQMLRLSPQNTHDQTVARWRIDVDRDARLREGCDGWGNKVVMLYVDGPLDGIEIAVTGEVLTSCSGGVLHGAAEPLPPALFLRDTPTTPRDPAIGEWARETAGGEERFAALRRINGALHERFRLDRGRPEAGLSAADAWTRETATPRDLAQIFAVAARSIGAPARYVSGYSLLVDDHRPGPHGWAEAWVEGTGWIGFDPCIGRNSGESHVRVAAALDAAGCAAVAGSRLGEGEERLEVDVSVTHAS